MRWILLPKITTGTWKIENQSAWEEKKLLELIKKAILEATQEVSQEAIQEATQEEFQEAIHANAVKNDLWILYNYII